MLTHFLRRKNTLRLVRPERLFTKLRKISVTGFSTFFIDVAMGILTVLFNRQIMTRLRPWQTSSLRRCPARSAFLNPPSAD